MRQRILGPLRGYYIVTSCLITGELGTGYQGWGKVFSTFPASVFDPDEVDSFTCSRSCSTREDALNAAEDGLAAIVEELPARSPALHDAPLASLAYVSKARPGLTIEQLQHLLTRARERNQRLDVTGMLVYDDGVFMQVLEGAAHHLNLVYRHIRHDPMHAGLIKLMEGPAAQRTYASWSMAFKAPGTDLFASLDAHGEAALTGRFEATFAQAALAAFARRAAHTALN
jgi:hypothetical protein